MKSRKKKHKPAFMSIRLPAIRQTGGDHNPAKGGKYRRNLEKDKIRKEIKTELK